MLPHVTRDRVTLESTDREQEGTANLPLRIILQSLGCVEMGDLPRMVKRVASSWDGALRKRTPHSSFS